MELYPALEFSLDDPAVEGFAAFLQRAGFPHRLAEQEGRLVLLVYRQDHVPIAQSLYERYRLSPPAANGALPETLQAGEWEQPRRRSVVSSYPLTLALVLACAAGFLLVMFQQVQWLSWLSFQGLQLVNDTVVANAPEVARQQLAEGEWWRLVTPVFLHFDPMHVLFNTTILWFLGIQIERVEGSWRFLLLALLTGVVSNTIQYLYSPHNLFGGMSGVNYGLLSYCWLANRRDGTQVFNLPSGFFWLSVLMMVLGFLDVFALFGYAIANWAHLAGFVGGLLLVPFLHRSQRFYF